MENIDYKYITASYRLYTVENGSKELFEEAPKEHPFAFISGLGTTLEDFENHLVDLKNGDKFEFTIPADRAYGDYDESYLIDLDKNMFVVNGKFDADRVKVGGIVPLMTSEGQTVNASVVEISDSLVKVDLNHPLAGCELLFEGEIIENRVATNKELQDAVSAMSGGCGCGSGCGCGDSADSSCGSGCGCGDSSESSCGGGCGCGC